MTGPITILVPVYRCLDDVRRCIRSVLHHAARAAVDAELLCIDDASPEPAVTRYLTELASREHAMPLRVLRNDTNLGFAATANRGLRAAGGDVVLLNADTIVTDGWLDRLAEAAALPGVATVTPLTNFGSFCTLPATIRSAFALDGEGPQIEACARFIGAHSLHERPEVITGVGFCMFITRHAIERCGVFDDETFGRGYGEEVDFSLRASAAGFRHIVEDATFVYHRGGGSFGAERDERRARASLTLHERWPHFRAANKRERRRDPLRVSFTALELALTPRTASRPHVLQLVHAPGRYGGTEKHVAALMHALEGDVDFATMWPTARGYLLRARSRVDDIVAEREYLLPGGDERARDTDDDDTASALEMALDMFDFDAVHIQNLIGHSLTTFARLRAFPGTVVCSVRDLYLACPHYSLLYRNRAACGIPDDLDVCARCLPETEGRSLEDLLRFRATVAAHVDVVDHWVFASQSAADYFLRVYDVDPARIAIIPHGAVVDVRRGSRDVDEALIFEEPLRLGFAGRAWTKKGLAVVNWLADELRARGSSVEIHHFGHVRDAPSPAVHAHGPYDNEALPELLERTGIHAVLLPGPYAETFGHVMTEALVAGRPVIGTRYGALGERIRRHGVGWTVEPSDLAGTLELVEHLDAAREEVARATRRALAIDLRPVAATAGQYAELYQEHHG